MLERIEVLPKLAAFDPHVVGTSPLRLDVPTSDIDVICFAHNADAFTCAVWNAFGARPGFRMWQKIGLDRPIVANSPTPVGSSSCSVKRPGYRGSADGAISSWSKGCWRVAVTSFMSH